MNYTRVNNSKSSLKLLQNLSFILIILTISSLTFQIYQHNTIHSMEKRNQSLKSELAKFYLTNPSFEDLQKFLSIDNTDQKEGVNWDFKDSANMLRFNARKSGYNMCVVLLDTSYVIKSDSIYKDYWAPSTSLVVLNGAILDNGTFVYIDPEDDQIMKLDRYSLELKLLEKNSDALVATVIDEVQVW